MKNNNPNIGEMYHKIVIQRFTLEKKSNGEEMPLWVDHITTKAYIQMMSADEVAENERITSTESIRLKIRTVRSINSKMRIIWNNVVYEIKGVIPIARRYQEIRAEKNLTWTDEYLTQTDITVDSDEVTADKQNK